MHASRGQRLFKKRLVGITKGIGSSSMLRQQLFFFQCTIEKKETWSMQFQMKEYQRIILPIRFEAFPKINLGPKQ